MFLFRKKEPPLRVSAVVPAAGSASRMEGIDKLFVPLREVPVLVRTVEALSDCARIGEIVVVARGELVAEVYALVRDYDLHKVTRVVSGGDDRQASVFAGVAACDEEAELLLIHDGARPLITPAVVDACIDAALDHGAATAGVVPKDTIKVLDTAGLVASTPDRDSLAVIQTPQVFRASLYRAAMERAERDGNRYTDDCQLIERAGGKVFVVQGRYDNLKITTPEDLALATALLSCREEGMEEWLLFE